MNGKTPDGISEWEHQRERGWQREQEQELASLTLEEQLAHAEAVSTCDCTGLIPEGSPDIQEQEEYEQLMPFLPEYVEEGELQKKLQRKHEP